MKRSNLRFHLDLLVSFWVIQCITEMRIPDTWKRSTITMLSKKNTDNSDPKNYRPISITRLFERIILARLKEFLKENNIIITPQSGFRAYRQTKDNLLFISQKIQQGFNRNQKSVLILFDIASAFIKVWHNGLIWKLIKIRVPYYLVRIIQNFLHGRTFVVKIDQSRKNTRKRKNPNSAMRFDGTQFTS